MDTRRPTWVEVDLNAVAHNVRLLKQIIGERVQLQAVVKADGYGHGAVPVARASLASGAQRLAVALPEEAAELREAGLAAPILILGLTSLGQVGLVLQLGVAQTVTSVSDAEMFSREAVRRDRKARLHIKIDTGMGRLGFSHSLPQTLEQIEYICNLPGVEVEGIYTHFASSECDPELTNHQLSRLMSILHRLRKGGLTIPLVHAANSGAVLYRPETYLDVVRPGISIYGYHPDPNQKPPIGLQQALIWKTRIAYIHQLPAGSGVSYNQTYITRSEERVAVLPVGYADGYSRRLSNLGHVLVRGKKAPIRGRVCMDQTVISLEGIEDAQVGDEVTLIGRQEGQEIWADELARQMDTISYEVLCGISKRVPRFYLPLRNE